MLTASSLSRKVIDAARCSAVATVGIRFRNGPRRPRPYSRSSAGIGMPVATPPGATAFTRMPCGPYMKAATAGQADDAVLGDRVGVPEALPRSPASEATFTMAPRPAASIAGSTARVSLNARSG